MKHHNIVAGDGEESFAERYDANLTLPISEDDFLNFLKKHHLYYSVCGEINSSNTIPSARHDSGINLLAAKRCYDIIGDIDHNKHVGKYYRAFIDRKNNVFYIENTFAYTGP